MRVESNAQTLLQLMRAWTRIVRLSPLCHQRECFEPFEQLSFCVQTTSFECRAALKASSRTFYFVSCKNEIKNCKLDFVASFAVNEVILGSSHNSLHHPVEGVKYIHC